MILTLVVLVVLSTVTGLWPLAFQQERNPALNASASILALVVLGAIMLPYPPTLGVFYIGTWMIPMTIVCLGACVLIAEEAIFGRVHEAALTALIGVPLLLFVYGFVTSTAIGRTDQYHGLLRVETRDFASHVEMADASRIRLVPEEAAWAKATRVLGQSTDGAAIGSQLRLDRESMAIQDLEGELYWVIPLDFGSFRKWTMRKSVPGYVRVSAYDPDEPALLIDTDEAGNALAIRYTPGAFLGAYADRKAYYAAPFQARTERTFEIDEAGHPFYVYSLTRPTIGFAGYVTDGVVVLDAQTGDIKRYGKGEIPDWIDRVRPLSQAYTLVNNWGRYGGGWWNSVWGSQDIKRVTDFDISNNDVSEVDLWFVKFNHRNYWYTGITSAGSTDNSLVGLMFVPADDLSAPAVYYTMSGADESGVVDAVAASLGAEKMSWAATQPIPYNVWGRPTFVVPIISRGTGLYQKVAIIDASEPSRLVVEESLTTALAAYRRRVSQGAGGTAPGTEALTRMLGPVTVTRHGIATSSGEIVHYIVVDALPGVIFSTGAASLETVQGSLVESGDTVTIRYVDTSEAIVPIERIDVEGLTLRTWQQEEARVSAQAYVEEQRAAVEEPRAAEIEFDRLSPEEQRETLPTLRE